ncbi:polyprenyl synthetase family protein [Streptomyces sp. NPDC001848]|uniref:polyprenyl synthetase family protein n=1 Tax=Streptomyces sp. NPDC001848 TaxID=3364618 RepID=UPI00368DF6E6
MTTPVSHSARSEGTGLEERTINLLVEREMRRWVGDGENLMGVACLDALFPSGKLLRPRLCVWSAAAAGATVDEVLAFAAALECMHVATLMHDDVVDQAPVRRGRASSAEHFGISVALMAGDGLASTAYLAMLGGTETGLPADLVVRATRVVADAVRHTVAAIAEETLLREDLSCALPAVLEIVRGKTAALTSAACQAGAILADAPAAHEAAMRTYGEELGMAFQIRDDLLPFTTATPGTTNSGAFSDVANRQPTVPVLLARDAADPGDLEMLQRLFCEEMDAATAHGRLTEVLTRSGALDRATELARAHATKAYEALAPLAPSAARDRLAELTTTVVDRAW